MASRMRGFDWTQTALPLPSGWPAALTTALNILLAARFPMFLVWGEAQTFFYNDAFIAMLGEWHPRAMGSPLRDISSSASTNLSNLIGQSLAGGAVPFQDAAFTLHGEDGAELTRFAVSYSPVCDSGNRVGGAFGVCEGKIDCNRAGNAAIAEIARLREFFEQAPVPIAIMLGPEHRFEISNTANKRIVGDRAIIGKPFHEAVPEGVETGFGELLDHVYRTGEPYIGHHIPFQAHTGDETKQQVYMNFIYQPIRDGAGDVIGIFAVGSDVTQEVHATAALQKSERRAKAIIDAVPQMIWSASPDGANNFFNQQWYDFTGLPQGSLLGWEAVHPEDRASDAVRWQDSVANGTPYESKNRLKHRTGDYHWTLVRAAPVRDEHGQILEWIGSNTDIHGQELANAALMEANARKDEFLAMLAHELRNPLAPISAAAEILAARSKQDPILEEASGTITRQVKHIAHLVDDLLDASRVTRGHIELDQRTLNLKHVINDAVEQVKHLFEQRRHRFNLDLEYEAVHVRGDHNRLVQVVANLLSNAAKYTPERGRIGLIMEADDEWVTLCVQDDGAGMSPELISHAFDLFYQEKRPLDRTEGGLGIGLSLVKSLTELHGGTVAATSSGPGCGSRFIVRLPRQAGAAEISRPMEADRDKPLHGLRLLIVDDNIDAARMMGVLLEDMGLKVAVEHDAAAALERHRQGAFDVYLLDIGLPGMNGYELVQALRSSGTTADSLFIALSGYGKEKDRQASMDAGFHHHLVKPMSVDQLQNLLVAQN